MASPKASRFPPEMSEQSPAPCEPALLERMVEELRLRGYSPRTRKVYLGHVRRFLRTASPAGSDGRDDLAEAARRFLLHLLHDRKRSHSYVNQAISALRFFFAFVLGREAPEGKLIRPRTERRLPVILSGNEVARLLASVRNRKHRALLMLIYSAGLRVGEVVRLRVRDIDSERMLVHVRQAKGRKDRYVMLSETALRALRDYWREERPADWLFQGARPGRHLTERSVQKVFSTALKRSSIRKRVSVHSLRHAFATHLLESGTDVRFIQELLGHQSTRTTQIYTRVSRRSIGAIQSPLDRVWEDRGAKDVDPRRRG